MSELIVEHVKGDLLKQDVDVIVNAWNQNLFPHRLLFTQGVSGAIKKAAGSEPFTELRQHGILPLGAARLTGAGNLSFKGIIHVAGINHFWHSTEYSVNTSVESALQIAQKEKFQSIAFPAIGSGSSLSLGIHRTYAVWGLSKERSLSLIDQKVRQSQYRGRVVIVSFK
jgi:O-acetyl-ADP-ribose deacetylase (regulator of RNase III)